MSPRHAKQRGCSICVMGNVAIPATVTARDRIVNAPSWANVLDRERPRTACMRGRGRGIGLLMRRSVPVLASLVLLATSAACSRKAADEPSPTKGAASSPAAGTAKPASGTLTWKDPPAWKRNPPANPMRVAEYVVPKIAPDTEEPECVVNTFGAGQGGTVDANIDRWVRQFDPDSASNLEKRGKDVAGMKVTIVELAGTYRGMGMPGGPQTGPKKGYRMIAAIVESPKGMFFFKMTGPEASVREARAPFEAMLDSLSI